MRWIERLLWIALVCAILAWAGRERIAGMLQEARVWIDQHIAQIAARIEAPERAGESERGAQSDAR